MAGSERVVSEVYTGKPLYAEIINRLYRRCLMQKKPLNVHRSDKCYCVRRLLTRQHGHVGSVGDGKHVGRHLCAPLAPVHGHGPGSVDREPLVRIDGHAEQAGIRLESILHDWLQC